MARTAAKKGRSIKDLPADALRRVCDPDALGFDSTADLEPLTGMVGQTRAIDAINLSAGITHRDFNVYVLGNEGMGRHEIVRALVAEQAAARPTPCDWVYVNNFETPHKPNAIRLFPGLATDLKAAMQNLVDDLVNEISALFDSEEYHTQRRAIEEEFGQRHEEPIAEFSERVRAENVALIRTPMGFMLAAIVDGKPIKPEIYEAMPPDERQAIDAKIERLQKHLADVLKHGPQLEKERRKRIEELHVGLAERAVSLRVQEVADRFADNDEVLSYLRNVRQDMISNAELFLSAQESDNGGPFPKAIRKYHRDPEFDRYAVNIMVSHAKSTAGAAPVVREELPSLHHLTGRIEHISEMGTLATNFTLIKPGALHKANGGYLVLDARQLLSEPFAWDALKRCLQSATVTITSLADRLSLTPTISLEPEPIPLDVKVVLIGEPMLYYLLADRKSVV